MSESFIFDVDGTLMNVDLRVRRAKNAKKETDKIMDWDIFLDPDVMVECDHPNNDVCYMAKTLYDTGNDVIITSARNERHRDATLLQLDNAGVKFTELYLRADDDFRPDDIVKEELLQKIHEDGFRPVTAFDDRDQVVNMWRRLGLNCYQVREGKF
jgi:phosphoglycolate phosphatase-like HAD superfamily hydrolase|tara:strand:- start:12 stop:479 length:468 start_codon:yes stop_codon:yes gene_type:complete